MPDRLLAALVLTLLIAPSVHAGTDPTRVLVVYNASWPDADGNGVGDSLQVAQHYAARRGVPAANLLGVSCTTGTSYANLPGWQAFWDEIRDPVVAKLVELGPLSIDTILFCHGMPYSVRGVGSGASLFAIDDAMKVPYSIGNRATPILRFGQRNPYFEPSPTRPPDRGHFTHGFRFLGSSMWMTARLDGVTARASTDLVEGALYGERYISKQPGYYSGTAYVDSRYGQYTAEQFESYPFGYGSYNSADMCIAYGQSIASRRGWPVAWEPSGLEIGQAGAAFAGGASAETAPNALWYGGWYNYRQAFDVWEWLPGSAAVDLNSNSAQTFRTGAGTSFLGLAFTRGLTCGTGCIAEPFLSGHPRPEVFLHYMLKGYPFVEASMLCNPLLAWVNVAIGDPLYAPNDPERKPELDTAAPPAPDLTVLETGSTQRTVRASIDTTGRAPDLVVARVEFGATPAYGSSVDTGRVHATGHELLLDNLTPDALYHYRVTLTDPVGNTSASGNHVFYTSPLAPALAALDPPSQVVSRPSPVPVDLTFGTPAGIPGLTGLQLLLSAPHLGLQDADITAFIPLLAVGVAASPQGELLNARLHFPGTMPRGSYGLTLRVFHGTPTPVEDSAAFTIQ